ncbi:MAG TPA: hypothetical protein VGX00_05090 [Thermoplasmata archaeon]|nr:hypothetical protein [Thermoplasmata archaeon]
MDGARRALGRDRVLRLPNPLLGTHRTKLALLERLVRGEATVDGLATAAGIHRTVAQRHLTQLAASGLVGGHPVRGARGRPKTLYTITAKGREVFVARYDLLLDSLVRGAVRRIGIHKTRVLFKDAAATLAADLGFPRPIEAVVERLQEVGFQPVLRREANRQWLVSHNCPVFGLAERSPDILCRAFHSKLLDAAVPGMKANLLQTMAKGAPYCVHELVRK